jgi:hypothetical protein
VACVLLEVHLLSDPNKGKVFGDLCNLVSTKRLSPCPYDNYFGK